MSQLRPLGLTPGWIYETVVCTYSSGSPHASPVGVWTHDLRSLCMELYDTSLTLTALRESGEFVVDLPADAWTFFLALREPSALRFERACRVSAPCLANATATIELAVTDVAPREGRTLVTALVRHVSVRGEVRLINRAEGLLVESLIVASRAALRPRESTLAVLAENARAVERVAPGSSFAEAMSRLRVALTSDS